MSVLDDATIIYVPGVYKTSAVALQKPISAGSVSSLTFARASTGTRVNSAGLIESVATNIPRIDFLNDTCGSQLLEPARTNLYTYSEQFDNAAWSKGSTGAGVAPVVTADAGVAPDGNTTADRIQFDAGGGTVSDRSFVRQTVTTSTVDYTLSFWVKSFDGNPYTLVFQFDGGTSVGSFNVTNEWQRVSVTNTSSGGSLGFGIDARGSFSDQTADILLWGAQLEVGAYPTSYIKTEALTVTRSAETLSQTGLATELGDSEGTIYFEGSVFDADGAGFGISLSDGTLINRVFIGKNSSVSTIRAIVTVGGFAQFDNTGSNWVDNTDIKIALKYAANDFALWVNGVEVATDLSGNTFGDGVLTRLGFDVGNGIVPFYGNVQALAVWDRALTDTELEDLTT